MIPSKAPAPPKQPITLWWSPCEAADYLGVSVNTIYTACAVGGLKHSRLTGKRFGKIRIRREWLDAWMESQARVNKF